MPRSLLALGSNLGDRHSNLAQTCAAVALLPGCQLLARSRWHTTTPIGGESGQGEFLNGAILLETRLAPQSLAVALQQIETSLGRQRTARWDARTIDIDMLLYEQEVIETDDLIVPHPRMTFRKFVLDPAAEIAGFMRHPTSGWTLARLLAHLQNPSPLVVVTATEKSIADWLRSQVSQELGCPDWQKNRKNGLDSMVSQPDSSVKSPVRRSDRFPALVMLSPAELGVLTAALGTQEKYLRPTLVIVVDIVDPKKLRAEAASAGFHADIKKTSATISGLDYSGLGPLVRITVDDPITVLQEAEAALRCIWPDREHAP